MMYGLDDNMGFAVSKADSRKRLPVASDFSMFTTVGPRIMYTIIN